jgi:alkylated DNA repair dioxygenase AlkB
MRAIFFISFLFTTGILIAQNFNISLSEKHLKKLQSYQNGHKRLKQYYKFYSKDSLDHRRRLDKKYKRELDSAYRANRKQGKLERQLAKKGIILPRKELSYGDSLNRELKKYWAITKDSTASDSAKQVAKEKVREIALKQAEQYPDYLNALNQYQSGDSLSWETLASKVPGFDTLSGVFNSSPEEVFATSEKTAETMLTKAAGASALGQQFAEAEKLKQLPDQYMNEYKKYADRQTLEAEAEQKAAAEAVKVFEEKADYVEVSRVFKFD